MTAKWKFEAASEFFEELWRVQYEYHHSKVPTQPNHALIHRPYPSDNASSSSDQRDWPRFAAYVMSLNQQAPKDVSYKILYITRHGMGFHNKKHLEVGTEAWDSKWSQLDGYGDESWFDAQLTEVGVQQANDLSAFYKHLFTTQGAPLPSVLYTSPLTRCLQTTQLVFSPLIKPFRPIIKEDLRERWTTHTCDKRRTRTWIAEHWPEYEIEPGFAEEDVLGKTGRPETDEEHKARKQRALVDIWNRDEGMVLSLTMHSYAIRSLQDAVGAEKFRVREGSSIAMLIKGTKI